MPSTRVTPNSNPVPVNIVGSSVFARYNKISGERTTNLYITTNGAQPDAENYEAFLISYPGYKRVLQLLATGAGRGLFHSTRGNLALAVVNSSVYQISPTLGVTLIGTIASTAGEVFMAENLNAQICLVDGVNAYIYNYDDPPNLVIQTDGALGSGALIPSYVEYHNTFFLFGNGNTTANGAAWYAYSYSSPTTIVQTTQLALQTKADYARAVKRIPGAGNNVLVFGTTVAEIHTQVGGLLNYIRNQSVNINYGCLSVSTIGEGGTYLAWLAVNEEESPVIMVYDGSNAQRISTDGIDYLLSSVVAPQTSTAMLYQADGHLFYQLTFYDTRDNLTLLYDFNTKMFFNLSDQFLNYHPMRAVIYFSLKTYFISLNNGSLYELSSNINVIDENIAPATVDTLIYDIQRERITANIREGNSTRFRINSFVLTLEQGTDPAYSELDLILAQGNWLITEDDFNPPDAGIISEMGQPIIAESGVISFEANPEEATGTFAYLPYIPRVDLAISKDGSITWSNYVPSQLNTLGHRQNICHWSNMGVANDLSFKVRVWSRWRTILSNAMVDIVL